MCYKINEKISSTHRRSQIDEEASRAAVRYLLKDQKHTAEIITTSSQFYHHYFFRVEHQIILFLLKKNYLNFVASRVARWSTSVRIVNGPLTLIKLAEISAVSFKSKINRIESNFFSQFDQS